MTHRLEADWIEVRMAKKKSRTSGFTLEHPIGIRVSRDLTEKALIATHLVGPGVPDSHQFWTWYDLPPFKDEEVVLHAQLGYKSGKLEVVSLNNLDPRIGNSAAQWSEDRERTRAESLCQWLIAKGFAPGEYAWGEVTVAFDEKGGRGSAGVSFKVTTRRKRNR